MSSRSWNDILIMSPPSPIASTLFGKRPNLISILVSSDRRNRGECAERTALRIVGTNTLEKQQPQRRWNCGTVLIIGLNGHNQLISYFSSALGSFDLLQSPNIANSIKVQQRLRTSQQHFPGFISRDYSYSIMFWWGQICRCASAASLQLQPWTDNGQRRAVNDS